MTITDIQNLIELLNDAPGVVKLSVTAPDGSEVVIKRPVAAAPASVSQAQAESGPAEAAQAPQPKLVPVIATLVGQFFGVSPAVQQGDRVALGQKIGYIESMKIKNNVIALATGIVQETLVSEEDPVEYGQILFQIAPEEDSSEK